VTATEAAKSSIRLDMICI